MDIVIVIDKAALVSLKTDMATNLLIKLLANSKKLIRFRLRQIVKSRLP